LKASPFSSCRFDGPKNACALSHMFWGILLATAGTGPPFWRNFAAWHGMFIAFLKGIQDEGSVCDLRFTFVRRIV